jgi:hypothetical protein
MKYLKRINESKSSDIKEFCETYLAYLIDDGFRITIDEIVIGTRTVYKVSLTNQVDTRFAKFSIFSWDKISDQFIPFYQMLKKNYTIPTIGINKNVCFEYYSINRTKDGVFKADLSTSLLKYVFQDEVLTNQVSKLKVGGKGPVANQPLLSFTKKISFYVL